ncbi:hypothetical protein BDZ89DRAFT_1063765, partial [Hymenopellis radicata]
TTISALHLGIFVLSLTYGLYLYEPHIELAFYPKDWVHRELEVIQPLNGYYDVEKYVYGPKRTEVQAGVQLRMGLDCYDLAGTIRSTIPHTLKGPIPAEDRVHFHTQEYMLKSFFATQNVDTSRLILWSNGDLGDNAILQSYKKRPLLSRKDKKAWVDGDLIRLLLLWNYGGVWVDMDSLLTRDLDPLLEHEFVTQWILYQPFNGALMRFRKHSPYLCEAFHVMATSTPPRADSTDWGSTLYLKLWRRLIAGSIPPFKILPFCFSDGRSCRLDNRLPDPFVPDNAKGKWTMGLGMEEGGPLDKALGNVFGEFPKGGWVDRLLLKRYENKLS